jgi:hypothetical protein
MSNKDEAKNEAKVAAEKKSEAPVAPASSARQWYRVKTGLGSVKLHGIVRQEGEAFQASPAEAISVDNYLDALQGAPDA